MKQKLRMNFSIQTTGNWIARHKNGQDVQHKQMTGTAENFMIMYMDTLVKNSFVRSTSFSASKMPNYRLKLAKAIKRGILSN